MIVLRVSRALVVLLLVEVEFAATLAVSVVAVAGVVEKIKFSGESDRR